MAKQTIVCMTVSVAPSVQQQFAILPPLCEQPVNVCVLRIRAITVRG